MQPIRRFEDIQGWQKARDLTRDIYNCTSQPAFFRDFALRDQVRRAAVSIMANIAEGFDRDGNREFMHFLSQAKGSCAELQSHLFVARDQNYLNESAFHLLHRSADEVGRLIGGLMRYLRCSERLGRKFDETTRNSQPATRNACHGII